MHMNEFDQKTAYFGVPMRLVTCLETNKVGRAAPNLYRPGRFFLFKDVHEELKALNGGYVFCVKNRLGDVVLIKSIKIKDSPLLMQATPKFSRKGVFAVNWTDIFPEIHSSFSKNIKKEGEVNG